MSPRYQPLSIDSSGATTTTRSSSGGIRARSNPFYCTGCVTIFQQFYDRIAVYLPPQAEIVGYLSGGLFALGWWFFIDGVLFAQSRNAPQPIRFEDYVPGILSTLSLVIVNLIDKDTLNADDFSFSGDNVACKARAFAFVGVSMAIGAIGGALAILSLKYIVPGNTGDAFYFGIAITVQNLSIFLGSMILWFGRNSEEYSNSYPL
ncbi:hypothetical protein BJ742DRAFT_908478, partial [Cladochytrium replicatum]